LPVDHKVHVAASPDSVSTEQDEVAKALAELREMFPGEFISATNWLQIGVRHWGGSTLSEAMAKVREWKEQQNG
jgi:hypothetical protein